MFIEEKTLCSSVAQSCLQKLGCKREPAICGLPHHGRAVLALGFRVGQSRSDYRRISHSKELEAECKIWSLPGFLRDET